MSGAGDGRLPVVLGMTGASGPQYGITALRQLAEAGVPAHLVMSKAAATTIAYETDSTVREVKALAAESYSPGDLGAAIASGSFRTRGMVVAPCSVKTLSGIAHSYEDNLLLRAAGVTLKERRPLVLMFRENPLHLGHIRLMLQATENGAVVFPPTPAFYTRPTSLEEVVRQSCARALDQLGLDIPTERWQAAAPK